MEHAERLIPELMVPLTRLAELVSSSLSFLAQLTFFGRPESTFASYLSQRPHGRQYDHCWARLPTRISLTFLRQRKKVCLREKYSFKITHLLFTDIVKHLISKYSSHPPLKPLYTTLSPPSATSVTHLPMILMS